MLAVLLGVNIGPNATYAGSLATLLWRRLLPADARAERRASSTCSALLTVPAMLAVTTRRALGWRRVIGAGQLGR